jgi:hypothetical protein
MTSRGTTSEWTARLPTADVPHGAGPDDPWVALSGRSAETVLAGAAHWIGRRPGTGGEPTIHTTTWQVAPSGAGPRYTLTVHVDYTPR